jgi:hypothetical protein
MQVPKEFLRGASEIFTALDIPRWSSVCGSHDLWSACYGGHRGGVG